MEGAKFGGDVESSNEPYFSNFCDFSVKNHAMHDERYHGYGMEDLSQRPQVCRKMDQFGDDVYSFVDELQSSDYGHNNNNKCPVTLPQNGPKKRGRKRKLDLVNEESMKRQNGIPPPTETKTRKRNRFHGMTEQELSQKTIPDYLIPNLDVVIIGINPGLFAAFKGRHYAGPGNHLWKCLFLSGLINEPYSAEDDYRLPHLGIGFTNLVSRPTKGSSELTRREIREGCQQLLLKLQKFCPKVAVFNGKLVYEIFSGRKDFPFGRQKEPIDGTHTWAWVMPSSSARCAQLPRCTDKIPFFLALKKFCEYLRCGKEAELHNEEFVFYESSFAPQPYPTDKMLMMAKPTPEGEPNPEVPVKKKRGRPRKGMEKNQLAKENKDKLLNKANEVKSMAPMNMDGSQGPPKKKRGRPKKYKPEEQTQIASQIPRGFEPIEVSTPSGPATLNNVSSGSSSVSGYSSGTGVSEERRENGSLSNAGSSGPSPSHHSFTTQSDLSSEISAAMDLHSCGSPPNSPSNCNNNLNSNSNPNASSNNVTNSSNTGIHANVNEQLFDQSIREEKHHHFMSSKPVTQTPSTMYPSPMDSQVTDGASAYNSMYHGGYASEPNSLSSNSRLSNVMDDNCRAPQPTPTNFQSGPSPPVSNHTHGQQPNVSSEYPTFDHNRIVDMASKSLSGLESLVDQIPSIAEHQSEPLNVNGLESTLAHVHSSHAGPGVPYEGPSGFLPYSHHHTHPHHSQATNTFPSTSYYGAMNGSSGYHLGSPYPPPPSSVSLPFGYANYSQYGPTYAPSASPAFHLSPSSYTSESSNGYSSTYPSPHNPYSPYVMSQNSNASSQRFPPRLHLRQETMDLGHLGF